MPLIVLETLISAPPATCFDLARSVEAHVASTAATGERAASGVTSGLLGPGDEVTWEALHLGVRQRLTARITRFEPPHSFEDEMVRGAFASFTHRHEFHAAPEGTQMIDRFEYAAPLGVLGRIADWLFLERYVTRLLRRRATFLKARAEGLTGLADE